MGKLILIWYYLLTRWRSRTAASREVVERRQERRIRRHLRFVRKRSAFYREHWGELSDAQWRQFPIIEKLEMMEQFDRLNTAGVGKDEAFALALAAEQSRDFTPTIGSVTVGLSSGTSGNRGLFLVSGRERMAWAGIMLAKVLPRSLLHAERVAFFLRADSNLYGSVGSRRLQFAFYDMLQPLAEHIVNLNRQQPTIVAAPPSMLRALAEAQQDGRLRLGPRPRRIISVAEVLDPLDRVTIEAAFGQSVHQIYQCTEGFIASTCKYGTLHVNEDIVVVQKEVLDDGLRKFVPIVTDLSRTTQPIVRYRLNDILTERAEPCPCGSAYMALERIEGRCDDLFYFHSLADRQLVLVYPDFITRVIISSAPDVAEYKVVQHAPAAVEVSIRLKQEQQQGHAISSSREKVQRQIFDSIQQLCDKLGCEAPHLEFSELHHEPGLRKLRRVERRFQP
ncbi:adenylate cyclase [Paenibacillus sp. H1-7]|nr:adenylate cyclase [Paenibacillus sp. H1-7]